MLYSFLVVVLVCFYAVHSPIPSHQHSINRIVKHGLLASVISSIAIDKRAKLINIVSIPPIVFRCFHIE